MADVEQALRELRIDWPPTPDIAAAVRARIGEETAGRAARRRRFSLPRPALAYALTLLLVAAVAGLAASPSARSAILEFLGLKGAKIERRAPDAPPPPPDRGELGEDLALGERVALSEALRRAEFTVAAPTAAGLGDPDAVYYDVDGDRVSFVYAAGPGLPESEESGAGLLVSVQPARVTPYIQKSAGPGTTVEPIQVGEDRGYYLSGAPHGYAYGTSDTDVRFEDQRLAGPTLLLERGDLLLRIEGSVSKARALEIARSITATSARRAG